VATLNVCLSALQESQSTAHDFVQSIFPTAGLNTTHNAHRFPSDNTIPPRNNDPCRTDRQLEKPSKPPILDHDDRKEVFLLQWAVDKPQAILHTVSVGTTRAFF